MSEFKKANKSRQRVHKERSQPFDRQKLGLLEKKKDYQIRARHSARKKATLKALQKRALEKNPDEFYLHMVNSRLEDGYHMEGKRVQEEDDKQKDESTLNQIKLMQTQDFKYITYKLDVESKKIEKLKSSLHFLDCEAKPRNKHTFFVDSEKEGKKLDVADRLDTFPELLGRSYNRPRRDALKAKTSLSKMNEEVLEAVELKRRSTYKELGKRMKRKKELLIVTQKMEIKRHLANTKEAPPRKISIGTNNSAPIYKWTNERKK